MINGRQVLEISLTAFATTLRILPVCNGLQHYYPTESILTQDRTELRHKIWTRHAVDWGRTREGFKTKKHVGASHVGTMTTLSCTVMSPQKELFYYCRSIIIIIIIGLRKAIGCMSAGIVFYA